jgi:hypothetical protein
MKSSNTHRRTIPALVVVASLLIAAFAATSSASAATIYACQKKKGGTIHLVTKKAKCKKGETKISWNTTGPAGKNGTNGTNGASGKDGAPGQPQKAVTFKVVSEAPLLGENLTSIFTLSGVSVRVKCFNVLLANGVTLEATGPAGTQAESGMVDSRANNTEETQAFQRLVYNVAVSTNTVFGELVTNGSGEIANVGHINATITAPGAVILISAFVKVAGNPEACTVSGAALSIPA